MPPCWRMPLPKKPLLNPKKWEIMGQSLILHRQSNYIPSVENCRGSKHFDLFKTGFRGCYIRPEGWSLGINRSSNCISFSQPLNGVQSIYLDYLGIRSTIYSNSTLSPGRFQMVLLGNSCSSKQKSLQGVSEDSLLSLYRYCGTLEIWVKCPIMGWFPWQQSHIWGWAGKRTINCWSGI